MEIKELRIGNNVFFNGKVQEISSIHSDNTIRLKENKDSKCHGCYKVNRIKPIPLTEEVLLNCGFEKIGEWFCKNDLNISIIHDKTTFGCNEEYEIPNVKFLHTLQNLYFALTGEELTYNHS